MGKKKPVQQSGPAGQRAGGTGKRAGGGPQQGRGAGGSSQIKGGADLAVVKDRMDVWDRISWICLHIMVVLVPIAMSNLGPFNANGAPLTYDQFDIVKVFFERGLMLVAVAAWAIGVLVRGGKFRWSPVMWLILIFLAWVALTSIFSISPATAIFGKYRRFEGLISFITYAVTFFMALQMVDRPSRARSLARSLAIGGFLVAFYGLLQVVGAVPLLVAEILEPTSLALTVLLPLVLGWRAWATKDAETRRAFIVGGVIALLGGIMFHSAISDNLAYAVNSGAAVVSLDPVRWGTLPFETNRAFSTFGNPDLLGGYMIFPWAVTIGLALSEKHRLWKVIYWLLTLLNAFVGLYSFVRGAWIGATVAVIVIVIVWWRARKDSDLRLEDIDWTFLACSFATIVTGIVVSSLRPDAVRNVLTRIVSIFNFDSGSALTRFQIWEAARAAVAESPILGWGADTFRLLFPIFKPAEYVEAAGYLSVADNVHNYPLQLATGVGIPGALMMYGSIGWVLVDSARAVFAKGTGRRMLVLAGFWAAVIGYVVHLMFGLSVTGSTIFLWLSMGVLLSPSARVREVRPMRAGWVPSVFVAVLLLTGTVLNCRYIIADNHYLTGRLLTSGTSSVAEIKKAIELNPYNEMYKLELGSAYQDLFLTNIQAYASGVQAGTPDEEILEAAMGYLNQSAAAYSAVIEYVPYEYDTYVFLTNLYNEAAAYLGDDYYDQAIATGEVGVLVEQYGPAVRVQLAIAYLGKGDADSAIKHLEVATSLDSDYLQAWLLLASTYKSVERYDDARAAYEHVIAEDADNETALAGIEALDALEASASVDATRSSAETSASSAESTGSAR